MSCMKPKGHIHPHRALPKRIEAMKKEARGNHGKTMSWSIHCKAVKASPTVFCGVPIVHMTGSKMGMEVKP